MVLRNHPKWRIAVDEYEAEKGPKKKTNGKQEDPEDDAEKEKENTQNTVNSPEAKVLKRPQGCKAALAAERKEIADVKKKTEKEEALRSIAIAQAEKNSMMKEQLAIMERESHRYGPGTQEAILEDACSRAWDLLHDISLNDLHISNIVSAPSS